MNSLLSYHAGTTCMHKANPLAKLALALAFVLACFFSQSLWLLGAYALLIIAMMCAIGILRPLLPLARAVFVLACVMFVFQTLLAQADEHIFLWISQKGLVSGIRTSLKLFCFALPLVSMLTITKLTDLSNAAVEHLHIPYCYAFTIMTALRFVPIFSYEMKQITEAQAARGVQFDTKNPFKKLWLMMPLVVPLLVLSVRKADTSALAAEARGFYLRDATSSYKRYPFAAFDGVLFLVSLILVALSLLLPLLLS